MGFKHFMKTKTQDFIEQRKIKNLLNKYLSKEDLQKLSKKLHLKTSGNKGNLINRILGSPDFNLNVLQRTFTKTELKNICAEMKLETTGTDIVLWNRILVEKGIIDRNQELIDSPDELSQIEDAKKEITQIPAVRRRTTTSDKFKPTTEGKIAIKTFMNKICNKEELQLLTDEFNLKRSGTKSELIERITSQSEFKLDDIQRVFYKENLQDICRNRDLLVSGTKDELWERIVEDFNVTEPQPKRFTRPTGEKRTILLATAGRQRRPRTITKSQLPTYQEEARKGDATLYEIEAHNADEAREIIKKGGLWKVPYENGVIFSNAQSMKEISLVDVETPTTQPTQAPHEPIIQPTPSEAVSEPTQNMAGIVQLIREWHPRQIYKFEEAYKAALGSYLEKHKLKVREEAVSTRVDLLVEDSIPIEIKKNPDKSAFDRLIGQMERNIKEYGKLIIVICSLQRGDLFNEYKSLAEDKYSSEQVVFIVKGY